MEKKKRKLLWALTAALVAALCLPGGAFGAELPFTDVPKGSWYYEDVKSAHEKKLIDGLTPTRYAPDENMTNAEAVKLAACMHQIKKEGKVSLANGQPWYSTYVSYAKKNNLISSDLPWNAKATRAGYMQVFAQVLPDMASTLNTIADGSIPDVPMTHPNAAAIYKLYRLGIVQGVDQAHNCSPASNIKRSEVAAILTRMMEDGKRISFAIADAGKLIVVQPVDQKAVENTNATFSLTAKGEGLTYQWQHDDMSITYGPSAANEGDEGKGKTVSVVGYLPKLGDIINQDLLTPHLPDLVDLGLYDPLDKGKLDLVTENLLKPQIKHNWVNLKDGADIKGSGSDKLTVKAKPELFLSGSYRCIVQDNKGQKETSKEVALISQSPGIRITQQPHNQTLKEGAWAELKVEATGPETMYYQWKNGLIGDDLKDGTDITGAKTANLKVKAKGSTLIIPPMYYCEIKDRYGTVMSSSAAAVRAVNLKILSQPEGFMIPKESQNQWFSLAVIAAGDPEISYQWKEVTINGLKNLTDGANYKGTRTSVLEFNRAGRYVCEVNGSYGQTLYSNEAGIFVDVNLGSVINVTQVPQDVNIKRGETAAFTIDFNSAGDPPRIRWQKRFSASEWKDLQNGDTYSGVNTRTLSVRVKGETYLDQYRCLIEVDNPSASYASPPVRIKQKLWVEPGPATVQVQNKSQFIYL